MYIWTKDIASLFVGCRTLSAETLTRHNRHVWYKEVYDTN